MTIAREEIFGPVTAVMKFTTLDEGIARANKSVYGLAAGIFTWEEKNQKSCSVNWVLKRPSQLLVKSKVLLLVLDAERIWFGASRSTVSLK